MFIRLFGNSGSALKGSGFSERTLLSKHEAAAQN
jgi:hypothetical protein